MGFSLCIQRTSYLQPGSAAFCEMVVARQKSSLQGSCALSLSWSCTLYCSSPAASFVPEIPLGFISCGLAVPPAFELRCCQCRCGAWSVAGRVIHWVPRPSWSHSLQLYTLSPQGESQPLQSHCFLNIRHLFPTFLTV